MTKKKVTVLMPVYNGEKYLNEAIDSILNQTYKNFDFLIINDGSTDSSEEIITSYIDSRIISVKNEKNLGLIRTLNKGLGMINTEYVIRMDADDISLPKRIEKQVKFMDENKNIAVSGTWIKTFMKGSILTRKNRTRNSPSALRTELFFKCSIMHPTVIMRNNLIKNNEYYYGEEFETVEDFALWQKISVKHDVSNIPEILLKYRLVSSGITMQAEKNKQKRDLAHIKVYRQAFTLSGISFTEEDLFLYRKFLTYDLFSLSDKIENLFKFLIKIKNHIVLKEKRFDEMVFQKNIKDIFLKNIAKFNLPISDARAVNSMFFENYLDLNIFDAMKLVFYKVYFILENLRGSHNVKKTN